MEYKDYHGYKVFEDGTIIGKRGNPMKPCDNGKGYLIINLRVNGKALCKAVHRILAESWIPNPEGLSDVDHIDGDRRNNSLTNLRWVTHGENIKHSYSLGNRSAVGTNNARSKMSEEDIHRICCLLQSGKKIFEIRNIGYPRHVVSMIKHRKQWKHISKDYNF